jgi:hypothetical protein
VAGCDPPYYGKIVVYSFPKGELVYGPSQIDALINQDTNVAEMFTLWDQVGSQVERGRMTVLPVGDAILYIEPVYLKSAAKLKIPELKRVIMSQGNLVAIDNSLEDAYATLQQRLKAELQRMEQRYPATSPGPAPPPATAPPQSAQQQPAPGTPPAAPPPADVSQPPAPAPPAPAPAPPPGDAPHQPGPAPTSGPAPPEGTPQPPGPAPSPVPQPPGDAPLQPGSAPPNPS